jgi:hypothetical protein
VLKTGGAIVAGSALVGTASASHPGSVSDGDNLQAAIDAASDGDTIEVHAGTYEGVEISKDVSLIGVDGPSSTTINGVSDNALGNAVLLTGHTDELAGIEVSGFTLHSDGGSALIAFSDGNTDFDTQGVTVSNVVVDGSQNGILFFDAKSVEISDCEISGVGSAAVSMAGVSDVTVVGNDLRGNGAGVGVGVGNPESVYPDNEDVRVSGNNIVDNDVGVANADEDLTVDATENWWGHASGPGGPDGRRNPAGREVGRGDDIEGDVDFDPWLRRPV